MKERKMLDKQAKEHAVPDYVWSYVNDLRRAGATFVVSYGPEVDELPKDKSRDVALLLGGAKVKFQRIVRIDPGPIPSDCTSRKAVLTRYNEVIFGKLLQYRGQMTTGICHVLYFVEDFTKGTYRETYVLQLGPRYKEVKWQ